MSAKQVFYAGAAFWIAAFLLLIVWAAFDKDGRQHIAAHPLDALGGPGTPDPACVMAMPYEDDPKWPCHDIAVSKKIALLKAEGIDIDGGSLDSLDGVVICGNTYNGKPMPDINCPSDRPRKGRGQ